MTNRVAVLRQKPDYLNSFEGENKYWGGDLVTVTKCRSKRSPWRRGKYYFAR